MMNGSRTARCGAAASAALILLSGCAARYQREVERDLASASKRHGPLVVERPESEQPIALAELPDLDGSLGAYLTYALAHSPQLRAAFHRWRAAVEAIAAAYKLPEPRLTYAYFISNVETRVGPQRHRIGLSQMLPWPTRILAAADAASAKARAAQRNFEGLALQLRERIAAPYWRLWKLERVRQAQQAQLVILQAAAEAARARLEVGQASLADLSQIDVRAARTRDRIAANTEEARMISAQLAAELGLRVGDLLPVAPAAAPAPSLPQDEVKTLVERALQHPRVEAVQLQSEAATLRAEAEGQARWPSFGLGFDYMENGPARMSGVPDSGKDAAMVMLSVDLPVWWNVYGGAEKAAEAEGLALRAEAQQAADLNAATVLGTLAELRDAARRIQLYESTLLPQARATFQSVRAAFETGRSTIAALLMAQDDVLDLEVELAEAQRKHATAWARLEAAVGSELTAQEVNHAP